MKKKTEYGELIKTKHMQPWHDAYLATVGTWKLGGVHRCGRHRVAASYSMFGKRTTISKSFETHITWIRPLSAVDYGMMMETGSIRKWLAANCAAKWWSYSMCHFMTNQEFFCYENLSYIKNNVLHLLKSLKCFKITFLI